MKASINLNTVPGPKKLTFAFLYPHWLVALYFIHATIAVLDAQIQSAVKITNAVCFSTEGK